MAKKFEKGKIKSLKVGSLYHSKTNNKCVRLVKLHIQERICTIKCHEQTHLFESEVFFQDLEVATPEQVTKYFQR